MQCCAENAVLTNLHPRTAVSIVQQVYENDGSLLATAINAACLALLDSAISMRHLVVAACCAVHPDGSILLDPTSDEEKVLFPSLPFYYIKIPVDIIMLFVVRHLRRLCLEFCGTCDICVRLVAQGPSGLSLDWLDQRREIQTVRRAGQTSLLASVGIHSQRCRKANGSAANYYRKHQTKHNKRNDDRCY